MRIRYTTATILGGALAVVLCAGNETKLTEEEIRSQASVAENIARIGKAVHDYEAEYRHFPPHAISTADGTELLSWRVAILPYLGEGPELHKQFKLDEAWDSANNKKLLAKMPAVYFHPRAKTKEKGMTFWRVFVGTGTAFERGQRIGFRDFVDGSIGIAMFVEAADAVPWTKPDELEYIHEKPLPKLGGHFSDGFFALSCFGEAHKIVPKFDEHAMRCFILRNDGTPLDLKTLTGEK